MNIYTLAKIMEQIEEATVQIDKNTTTGSRLALILIDNALELSIWEKITYKHSIDDEDYEEIVSGKFMGKLTKNYKSFHDKTNFLVSESIITQKEKTVFDICHKFRNEAYHQNIIRELIINDLAKIYLEACCNVIFKLFDSSFYMINSMKPVPELLTKYKILNSNGIFQEDKIEEAVGAFLNNRVCTPSQFFQTLESDIHKRIEKVRDDIDYIESVSTTRGNLKNEQLKLDSFSHRAYKLGCKNDISNALTRYCSIDNDLIAIELSMNFISGMLSRDMDLRFDQYREDRYLETHDFP